MNTLKIKILTIRLASQDPEAFAEVYDLYVQKIYRFVFYKVSSVQEAEDITSQVFLKAWEYLGRDDTEIRNLNSFLYQIARNLVIDFYRERAKKEYISIEATEGDVIDKHMQGKVDTMREVARTIESEELSKYLRQLKDEYREVVVLRHIEGYSTREIAKILEKTPGNVRVLLHRAMKALEELAQESEESKKN